MNGEAVENEGTANWQAGENDVEIVVTTETDTKTYTVTVTCSADTAQLSALTLGTLTLDPTFDADTYEYATTTTNATNAVTATGDTGVEVAIKVNGAAHTSGDSATWETGENTVTVDCTGEGMFPATYTVTVTKSGE